MNKYFRMLLVSCMTAVLAFGCMALSGCGQSDEEVVKEGVTQAFDTIKGLDEDTIESMLSESSDLGDMLDTYGIDAQDFFDELLDGFDYEIGDISIEDDTADISVTCSVKDMSQYSSILEKKAEELQSNSKIASMSTDELNEEIGKLLLEALDECEMTSKDVSFQVTKEDNTWQFDEAVGESIGNTLFSTGD